MPLKNYFENISHMICPVFFFLNLVVKSLPTGEGDLNIFFPLSLEFVFFKKALLEVFLTFGLLMHFSLSELIKFDFVISFDESPAV